MVSRKFSKLVAPFKAVFERRKAVSADVSRSSAGAARFTFDTNPYARYMPKAEKRGANHPYLRSVGPQRSFKLKTNDFSVYAEVYMMEELYEALKHAPNEAVAFHMSGRNDFANWIRECIGDWWLGSRLEKISVDNPSLAKDAVLKTLDERISKLKKF